MSILCYWIAYCVNFSLGRLKMYALLLIFVRKTAKKTATKKQKKQKKTTHTHTKENKTKQKQKKKIKKNKQEVFILWKSPREVDSHLHLH